MSRPRKQAEFLPAPDNDEEIVEFYSVDNDGQRGETTQKRKLEDIINDLNDETDDVELRVYRQSALGGKASMTFLDAFPPDKFTLSQLQVYLKDKYGGGDYRIHVRAGGHVRANRLISIEAPKDDKRSNISEAGDILSSVLGEMRRQNERMLELMHSRNNDDDQEEKVLSKMMKYKALFGSETSHQSSGGLGQIKETLELFAMLGINLGGGAEKETGFMDILEKSLPVVLSGMSQQSRQLPQPQQTQYKQNPIQPEDDIMLKEIMIKNGLNQLLVAAQKNSDPGMYAQLVLDQFGEQRVLEFFSNPEQIDKIIKTNPKLAEHIEWFELLIEHLKALMGQESKVSDQYDDLTGDDDNDTTGESDHEPVSDDS